MVRRIQEPHPQQSISGIDCRCLSYRAAQPFVLAALLVLTIGVPAVLGAFVQSNRLADPAHIWLHC